MSRNVKFDQQAEQFDRRAGLPEAAGRDIAATIKELTEMTAGKPEIALLEIGAGTGQIGEHLLQPPFQYVGVDLSGPMLQVFRQRVAPGQVKLVELDANRRWPVDDHSTDVVFSSRTLHLLDRDHVVREFFRVASPAGAALICGRARRDPTSVQAKMRQRMHQLLRELGVEGRANEKNLPALLDACCAAGAARFEPRVAHSWDVEHSPLKAIESWQGKEGLAGIAVEPDLKAIVLDRLRVWAAEHYGDMRQKFASREEYVLEGVRIK